MAFRDGDQAPPHCDRSARSLALAETQFKIPQLEATRRLSQRFLATTLYSCGTQRRPTSHYLYHRLLPVGESDDHMILEVQMKRSMNVRTLRNGNVSISDSSAKLFTSAPCLIFPAVTDISDYPPSSDGSGAA